jgi:hypothetical protein
VSTIIVAKDMMPEANRDDRIRAAKKHPNPNTALTEKTLLLAKQYGVNVPGVPMSALQYDVEWQYYDNITICALLRIKKVKNGRGKAYSGVVCGWAKCNTNVDHNVQMFGKNLAFTRAVRELARMEAEKKKKK